MSVLSTITKLRSDTLQPEMMSGIVACIPPDWAMTAVLGGSGIGAYELFRMTVQPDRCKLVPSAGELQAALVTSLC